MIYSGLRNVTLLFFCILLSSRSFSQLTVTTAASAATLASTLAGPGVTVLNPVLTCPGVANGTFTSVGTPLAMSNGIVLTNGHAAACAGPEGALVSFTSGGGTDPLMAPLLPAGTTIVDACYLQFDIVATGDSIGFNYQFGSEEYRNAVCSIYTDVFGFFISGPGIVGAPNIALVPGTNIPVEINSVNNGGLGTVGGSAHINCTSLGAGSPFTAYYIDNTGGALMSYRGYTTKFRAAHAVTPCDTYHLHISIVDAGNALYDSGVFLEGASLTTNTYTFNHAGIGATINGVPNTIVKGCSPTTVNITAAHSNPTPTILNLSFGGTAVNGVDVTTIPGTVTLPAGSTSVGINVQAIPTPPGGSKTLTIYLNGTCGISDSVTINIMDTPSAHIITPDTSVCLGQSFQIMVNGTAGLSYSWAPPTGLSSTTAKQPICTPTANTVYTMTATLPGSGCPPIVRTISVGLISNPLAMVSHDTSICDGASVNLLITGNPTFTYNWSPSTGLSSSTVMDPVASPTVTTTYTVTSTAPGGACAATATVNITVSGFIANILTSDTTVCAGQSFQIMVNGTAGLSYSWAPPAGLSSTTVMEPICTPTASIIYTMTATLAGAACPPIVRTISVTLIDNTLAMVSHDTSVCDGASVYLLIAGDPTFTYNWSPSAGLSSSTTMDPTASPTVTTTYTVTSAGPGGACPATATVNIAVTNLNVNILTPDTTVCPGSSVNIIAVGGPGYTYSWLPATSLNNAAIQDPVATPTVTTTYTLSATSPGTSCIAVDSITIAIANTNITLLTPDTSVCMAMPIQIRLNGSSTYTYLWTPSTGLNNPNIMQPIATPTVNTTYMVTATYPGTTCTATAQFTVTILPPLEVSASYLVQACNSGIQLYSTPGGGGYTSVWSGPSGFADSVQNPYISGVTPADQGIYTVSVVDLGNGCVGSNTTNVIIPPSSILALTNVTSNQTINYGSSIQLNADNAKYYWWMPNDGSLNNRNISDPIATPTQTTVYTVYGMDSVGCMDSAQITIDVIFDSITIPSAFTPNGDGLNDIFRPIGMKYQKLVSFSIYNRWGQQIFFTANKEIGWDGTFNGVSQDLDTYQYLLIVALDNGDNRVFKGTVTLIR